MNRRIISRITAVALGAALLAAPSSPAQAAACVNVPVVAHRGGSERYVENTRNAFRNASNIGAGFWETDVRFTGDNVPVVMHDATIDRTTNGGHGLVAELDSADFVANRTVDDQPLPTLAEFLNDQSVDRAYAFVELKVTPTEAQWATFEAALTSREGLGGAKPTISSFDPAVLDQAATRIPGYARALIQSTGDANPADITGHATVLLKHHDSITWGRLAKWTGAGLKVYAWADPAADPQSEWARMAGYGTSVSGYITSSPQAYLNWQRGRTC